MKKEKHPVYYVILTLFILLLAVGIVLFVCAVAVGNSPFSFTPARSI